MPRGALRVMPNGFIRLILRKCISKWPPWNRDRKECNFYQVIRAGDWWQYLFGACRCVHTYTSVLDLELWSNMHRYVLFLNIQVTKTPSGKYLRSHSVPFLYIVHNLFTSDQHLSRLDHNASNPRQLRVFLFFIDIHDWTDWRIIKYTGPNLHKILLLFRYYVEQWNVIGLGAYIMITAWKSMSVYKKKFRET